MILQKKSPKISVVIPCYNHANYLPSAVESVLLQTLQDFEIIIVNDGSTDNTSEISEQIINDNSSFQIKVINQHNSGLSNARNTGISQSSGQYILPLDADDTISPTMLQECTQVLDHHKSVSIVYTDRQDFGEIDEVAMAGSFEMKYIKYFNQISYCSMYRKQIWDEIGGYRTNMKFSGEDWDFWVAAASRSHIGYHIQKPLFNYRRRSDGLFQEVQKNYEKIFAQIILNNPNVYSKHEIEDATNFLTYGANILFMNLSARFFYQIQEMEQSIFWKLRNTLSPFRRLIKWNRS
jgi:glycosyltransferase involved in cell wall biosynthesis